MAELPEFWRTEIWHPLSVHIPIALLLVATLFHLLAFFIDKTFFRKAGNILLIMGTASAWLAIYTGDLADGIVSRNLCDPTVLKEHENSAYVLTWLFTIASLLVMTVKTGILKRYERVLWITSTVLMLVGSVYLVRAGHLGAEVVYQQAGGVYQPSEDCREFVE